MMFSRKRCSIDVSPDGVITYRVNGLRHRLDGPAYITKTTTKWYYEDKLHREGGPALEETSGYKVWYHHGLPHRLDGPARIETNGSVGYYLFGERYFTLADFEVARLLV